MIIRTKLEIIRKMLINFEGYRNLVYKDSLGNLTVGIGHKLTKNELKTYKRCDNVKKAVIEQMYRDDINDAISLAKVIFTNYEQHNDSVKIFMVLQAFNMGNNLTSFKVSVPHVINFNYGLAYKGFLNSKWARQVKRRRAVTTCNLLLNKVEY